MARTWVFASTCFCLLRQLPTCLLPRARVVGTTPVDGKKKEWRNTMIAFKSFKVPPTIHQELILKTLLRIQKSWRRRRESSWWGGQEEITRVCWTKLKHQELGSLLQWQTHKSGVWSFDRQGQQPLRSRVSLLASLVWVTGAQKVATFLLALAVNMFLSLNFTLISWTDMMSAWKRFNILIVFDVFRIPRDLVEITPNTPIIDFEDRIANPKIMEEREEILLVWRGVSSDDKGVVDPNRKNLGIFSPERISPPMSDFFVNDNSHSRVARQAPVVSVPGAQ